MKWCVHGVDKVLFLLIDVSPGRAIQIKEYIIDVQGVSKKW